MPDDSERPTRARHCAQVDNSAHETGDGVAGATQKIRTQDGEFWYEDGTIILVARDIEFRVYKGLLVAHCPVFRDMFSLPQPQPSSPQSDGPPCPIVHLSDSPEDVKHVLRVYLARGDHSPFTTLTPESPSFDLISACIRLGHKYQMAKLLEHSVEYLKIWYPADVATWQDHMRCAAAREHYVPLGFFDAHAIGVVNLARLTGEPSILVSALLDCCSLEERVLDGFDRADGTHEELASADLRRCLMARRHLAAAGISVFVHAYGGDVSGQCTTTRSCREAFHRALVRVDDFAGDLAKDGPFKSLRRLDNDGILLCSHCLYAAMERARKRQEGIWKDLPGIFDIEVDGWGSS